MHYFTKPLLIILLLGFSSGLPLALTAATLAAWLKEAHVDLTSIGLFSAVATPYTLKFCWSPAIDGLLAPWFGKRFGRRRGWLLLIQIFLSLALALLALARPDISPMLTACAALLVAFASASQDIVIDAYRVEILKPEDQGKGAAMIQLGYRLGMLASGAGALFLAGRMGWQNTYFIMAAIIGSGVLITLMADEPALVATSPHAKRTVEQWLRESVIEPFVDFMYRESWLLILVFIVIYKLADAFIGIMTNPFYLDIGFSKDDIATIVKIYGTIATLLGTFMGGALVTRYGAIRILFIAGFMHALTNLLYVLQAHVGVNTPVLAISVAMENLTGGISAAAFVAYLSSLCNVHYTATQYALLSSLAAFGRTWLSTPAGYVAKKLGWEWFFALSALLAIPGLVLLWVLNRRLSDSGNEERPV